MTPSNNCPAHGPHEGPSGGLSRPEEEPEQPYRAEEDASQEATRRYLDLIASVQQEWETLDREGDASVQLSPRALSSIKESVRADARRGPHMTMPPTPTGPYSVSTQAMHQVIRSAIDSVPAARALKSAVTCEPPGALPRARGRPVKVISRISASIGSGNLLEVANQARSKIRERCQDELGLSDLEVDIHIEDLHDHHTK